MRMEFGAYVVTGCFFNFLTNVVGGREEKHDREVRKGKLPKPRADVITPRDRNLKRARRISPIW